MDGNCLLYVVNRDVRQKELFEVADLWETPYTKVVLEDGPTVYAVLDGISPEKPLREAPIKDLTLDQFLAFRVLYANGSYFTVHDVIDCCAHVLGGVHLGEPRTPHQTVLTDLQRIQFNGMTINVR